MSSKPLVHANTVVSIVCAALFISFSNGAAALTPTTAEPGTLIKNLGERDRTPSNLDDIVTVPKMDDAKSGVSTQKIFELKGIALDNTTSYKAEDFKSIYSEYIGQKVSFADLNAIAMGMTRKYRQEGYIFSRVIVPPQKVTDGIVHFQAVEGRIANVELVGNYKDNNGLIKKIAEKIRTAGPANTVQIERYLLLINDLPGITARSFIKPSKTVGGGDLVISVEEDNFEGSASLDNRGSRYLGPYRGELVGAFNNTFGLHDRTTVRALASAQVQELKYGEIIHEEQLGTEGLRMNTRVAVTDSEPGGNISSLGIEGDSTLLDIGFVYPVIRGRQMNVNLMGGFTGLNSQTDVAGVKTGADRVRYFNAGGHFDFTDEFKGVNQFDLHVAKGMDGLGATDSGLGRTRANGEQDFLRADLTITRLQDLTNNFSLLLSATGQTTSDPLLASEEFTVGGSEFGRGYDSGEIAGDRGYAGALELRYDAASSNGIITSYQPYTFIDAGRVFNLNPVVGEAGTASLASAGIGVRFNMVNDFSGYVEADSPLTRDVRSENGQKSRLFFKLLKRF